MAKLLQKYEGVTISTYELDSERVTIGRRSDNHIQLDDPAVSGNHACILRKANSYLDGYYDFYIEDLGSTNGTKVNDQQTTRQMLKDGDVIQMGSHAFTFDSGQEGRMETTAIFIPDD